MRTTRPLVLAVALVAALAACKQKQEPAAAGGGTGAVATEPGDGAAPAIPPDPGGPITRPFLYKIEKDGRTGHLFGTMHIGVDAERLPPAVWEPLDAATAFAMETNILDPSLIRGVMRSDGTTLEDELGPEYWAKLDAALPGMAGNLRKMKASAAAALLEIQGLPMTQPMDLVLLMRARKQGAEIVFLEEAQLQQALLDRWLDARALKMMLDERERKPERPRTLLDAYVAGDEAAIERMSFDRTAWTEAGRDAAEFDQMMKELLADRNVSWIEPIERMMASGDAFIAVGAAHLIGKDSVVELLRAKGYTVTRVTP